MKLASFLVLTFVFCSFYGSSQKYTEQEIRTVLDSLSKKYKGYNNTLQLNVTSLSLSELVNSVALENNMNISVDPSLNQMITYNFYDAQVKDMMVFLYLNFEIEFEFVGSILSIKKRVTTIEKPKPSVYKKPEISYNPANHFLSVDLKGDTLWRVAEEITRLSGKNFVISPDIRNKTLNAFIQNRPIDQVVEMIGKSNSIVLKNSDDFYMLSAQFSETDISQNKGSNKTSAGRGTEYTIKKNSIGNLDVSATDANMNDLLMEAANKMGVHYVVYSTIDGKATLELKDVSFEDLIGRLFNGTKYSFTKDSDLYIIGEIKQEGIRKTDLIRIENRTIESVKTAIPKELLEELEISEFVELNGLIVTGGERKIEELKRFITQIDVVVPMVQIDVMLLFSKSGATNKTGIKAGLKDVPTQTQGEVFPGLDVEMGSETINNILNAISGFGIVNLGQVTENFYLSLQALETNNIIEIESTPKVSTLNGHEASISIGETTYYQETQVNVQTSVTNSGVVQSKIWKSIEANLSVKIKPFVSTDEHVTLTITVEQDDFSGKIDPTSPPNISTQTFESMVRVKNGEVILLGGLEKKKKNDSGSGVPLLSRIPVLKWFFSSRLKEKEKSKLHILVRPIVTY
jgi:type IV pilus assembly protein PilQ